MAGNRLFVGVAFMCLALTACTGTTPNSSNGPHPNDTLPQIETVESTSTTVAPTTTTSAPSALTTPGATTTTTPAATTTTTINPTFDKTKALKLVEDPTWFTNVFPGFPLNPEVTLSTPQDRFGSAEAQQRAITDGFIEGLKRDSAPASTPPGTFAQVTLYFDTFASTAQAADAVATIFLQTSSLGLLTTIKIQSQGQTVYIWKPNDHPGLDLFYTDVLLGPEVVSVYGQGSNLTDDQIHQVAALMIEADNAALAQAA